MPTPSAPHVMLVVAPYYREIVDDLVRGALAELDRAGATHERFDVAGAFEIPVAISIGMDAVGADGSPRFDGFLALGCVIRGETSHYDLICNETARAIQHLALDDHAAIGFGVLTCENGEQARRRADPAGKDKGGEAARACLSVLRLKQAFETAA